MGFLEVNRWAYLRLHDTRQTIVGIHRRFAQIQILKNKARLRNPQFPRNAAQTIERSSGKLILFLTCQSNPGPAVKGSWLLAFSLQFVIRAGLHFDLIKPKGMAPNENQSSSRCKRGLRRSAWQSQLTLSSHLLPPSPPPPPSHAIVRVDAGCKRRSFCLTGKRVCVIGGSAGRKAFFNKIWPSCELNACKCIETTELHAAWRLGELRGGFSER